MRRKSQKAARLVREGDELLRDGDLDGADRAYHKASEVDSGSADAAWSIGCVESHRGDLVQSLAWAERALALDASHLGARGLAGNALLGLERHEEALTQLQIAAEAGDKLALAQTALCFEALRRPAEAEAALRGVLEDDVTYMTRHQPVAMYSHSPFAADLHHALARVLQAQGKVDEARLHYHLTKRIDPETELNPMYLDVMSTEELEDHPIDAVEHEPQTDELDETMRLVRAMLRASSYEELESRAAQGDRNALIPQLTGLIQATQTEGEYTLSARLRPVIDVVGGEEARELRAAIATHEWEQLLALAERVRSGRITVQEGAGLAAAFGLPPHRSALLDLVRRFVTLEPGSGLVLAQLVEAALETADAADRAGAALLVAKGYSGSQDPLQAEAAFERALRSAQLAGAADMEAEAELQLAYICQQRGEVSAAEERLRRSTSVAEEGSEVGLAARYALAILLRNQGRVSDAHRAALEAAEAVASSNARARIAAQTATLLTTLARDAGQPAPSELLATLQRLGADGSGIDDLRRGAWTAASENRVDDAIRLMRAALAEADRSGSRRDQAEALLDLGRMLTEAERWAEARETLESGLSRAEPEGDAVDRWPALMTLSGVCQELDDHDAAVEAADRAHGEAQRTHDVDRERDTDRHLAFLLVDSHPERAVHHAGRWLGRGDREDSNVPERWREGRYEAAADAFDEVASEQGPYRAGALLNRARAQLALGDWPAARSGLRAAASAFAADGDSRRAIDALAQLAHAQRAEGESVDDTLEELRLRFDALTQPSHRREAGILIGTLAIDSHEHAAAEAALLEALSIATSADWRDSEDEIWARTLLGTSYRRVGRNDDARAQYQAAIERAQEMRDEKREADLRGRLGIVLRQLGQLDEALVEYDRAIAMAAAHGLADEVAVHQMNRASVLFELGRGEEGAAAGIEVWRAFERRGNADLALRTLVMLEQQADTDLLPAEALDRLRALLGRDAHDADSAVFVLTERAMGHWRRGDVEAARVDMDAALDVTRARGERLEEVRALLNRSRLLDREDALADIQAATALARSLDNIELEVDALEAALDATLPLGGPEMTGALRELDRGWAILRRRLSRDADRVSLAGQASAKLKSCAAACIGRGEHELAFAVLELARARAFGDLLSESASTVTGDWTDALDLAPARALLAELGDDSLAVGLDVMRNWVFATALDPSGRIVVAPTRVSEEQLETLVDDFRAEVITYRGRSAQTWERQARALFEPVAEAIAAASTVVLLPDGRLNELPLHVVPMADGRRLIEHARTVYAPSLHALSLMRERRGLEENPLNSIVTVGVAFPDEARAISIRAHGPCLSGRTLAKKAVHDAVRHAKVVHFACHGYFDARTAFDCGLLLSTRTPPGLDDVLSVRELAEWSLQSDLVTLSACETGRGNPVPSDFLGLARGFAGVGARSVIASLWPVDDRATQRLMLTFYDDIRRQRDAHGHVDTASALRAAQLEHSGASLPDWAAFKLIGWPEFDWAAAA